jgi:hypothetical protein
VYYYPTQRAASFTHLSPLWSLRTYLPRRVAIAPNMEYWCCSFLNFGWGPNQVQPPAARRTWRLPGQRCYLLKWNRAHIRYLHSINYSNKVYDLWNVHTFECKLRMPRCKEHTWKVCSLWCGSHLSSFVYICYRNMVILCFCCQFQHSILYTHGNMNCLYAFAMNVPIFYI